MPFNQTGHSAHANIGIYNDVRQTNISGYARLYEIHGHAIFNQITDTDESKQIRSAVNVPRAQASRKDYQINKNSRLCFEGTRVALLEEVKGWTTDQGESKIYALSGLAGIGKSTVAYTIATWADSEGLLGASFFFSRDEVDRSTAKKFFTTLAYQLCLYKEGFAQAITSVLVTERGSTATTGSPREQVEVLILGPLKPISVSSIHPIVIVIDALDECDIDDVPTVLAGLRRMVQELPSFKVILTTRPQPLVSNDFATLRGHTIFHLQDIEDKIVNEDIRLYLKYSLSQPHVRAQIQDPTVEWYASDMEIESLVQAAGKLFIIASTAVLFILDRIVSDPEGQMGKLTHAFAQDRTPFKVLDNFYSVILRGAVPDNCDNYIVERYQSVVGALVVTQTSLPITSLAHLIGRRVGEIKGALRHLQSVIMLSSDDVPHIYHKSFRDYITDSGRCKDVNLRIDLTIHHGRIAMRCFEIMNRDLKYNILCLGGPAQFMDNEERLANHGRTDEQLREKIPLWLRYACVYWANHLKSPDIENRDLMNELAKFADFHLLHWFETLSLIGQLDSAHRPIRVALRLVKPATSGLFQLLSDGLRFISKFYGIIKQSALHTYYSALPFAPTETLLFQRYNNAVHNICRVTGGIEKWDSLIATLSHENEDFHGQKVKFSLDSAMFVSWDDKSVEFWDTVTGTPVSTISLNFDHVAIADNFSTVASAKDRTIKLSSSMEISTPVVSFKSSTTVHALALTSDGGRIATLLSDGTLYLYDTRKRELITSFGGFGSDWAKLTFSPTGDRLAYMPLAGGIIQLRDGINGEPIAKLDDQSEAHFQLVFSRDGSRLASMASRGMALWESESCRLLGFVMHTGESFSGLAISTDGSLIAIGYYDDLDDDVAYLQLRSAESGNLIVLIDNLQLHYEYRDASFSPGSDMLAIAMAHDIMVYDIKNRSVITMLPIFLPTSLQFSPDGTRLAAATFEGGIHLWDGQSIKASDPPSKGQAKPICLLAFSQDCARLACVFWDSYEAIEIWQLCPARRRIPVYDSQECEARSVAFSPNGRQLAARFNDDTIRLWNSEDGASIGLVQIPIPHQTGSTCQRIALSTHLLVAATKDSIALWDLRTLDLVGTVKQLYPCRFSFSNDGDLLAIDNAEPHGHHIVTVLNVMTLITVATFDVHDFTTDMAFLPNNSQLVIRFENGEFRSFNLVSNQVTYGPTFEHLVQLHHHYPRWYGIPVWLSRDSIGFPIIAGLFPKHKDPVPLLRIPGNPRHTVFSQGSSMFALGCNDGQVIFVQSSQLYGVTESKWAGI